MSDIILPHGEQPDGSIIDMYGNILSVDERLNIIEQVEGLPATGMADDIKHAVKENSIVIINGETGSGKTTQIGKMLFDSKRQIVVTQPRVLSAMSNADRVSKELLADTGNPYYSLGHGVGYRTGRGVSSSRISPLSFHTDGLELMRTAYSNLIPNILVLDEVHNFAIPTEILAMLMKYRTDIKIIIMSATLDPYVFQEYYGHRSSDIPVINIPGRTHPVTKYFNPGENYIESVATAYTQGKNILFFVPGKKEIEDHIELFRAKLGKEAEIFPLHADLPKEEQQKLLVKTTDKPRLIVCTNVAEESITIPYIDMVVDLGTHKVARYNRHGIQELRLENTAQANCLQRAGRAGRTHPGVYIRANDTSFDELARYPGAPLEREMLDKYILILLANGIDITKLQEEESGKGQQLFFHNFDKKLLEISYRRLAQIGAIDHTRNITPLGRDLLKLPLDIYHARMLREAIKRKCVEDVIYATAILEKKGFVSKDEKWKEIKMSGGKDSDLFGYTELLKIVIATTISEKQKELLIGLGIDSDELRDFIDRQGEYKLYELVNLAPIGIKNKKVKEIDELVMDLRERLTDSGIEITSSPNMSDKKICFASGSLHNVYKYDAKTKKFQNREHKTGKDTLYFKAGNVTLVEPTNHHLYIGQPFIIGGNEHTQDLNLLTFLTQIDEGHIDDARLSTRSFIAPVRPKTTEEKHEGLVTGGNKGKRASHDQDKITSPFTVDSTNTSNTEKGIESFGMEQSDLSHKKDSYEPIFQEDDTVSNPEKVIRDYARSIEKASKIVRHNNFFQTHEDARMYYLRYRLPDFLVEHNQRIRKYLENKTEDDIFTFKELLVRFLLKDEAHRINITSKASIAKTEKSFRHDTTILDQFLESEDPFIQAFRKGKRITLPSEEIELLAQISPNERPRENKEVSELRNQYAKLLGSIKWKMKKVDEERIKSEVLKEYFLHIDLYSGEFKTIVSLYQDIEKMSLPAVKRIMTSLKGVERKTKTLGKIRRERETLSKVVQTMKGLIRGEKNIDLQLLFSHEFGEDVSEKYVDRYYNTLRLAQSKDKRKRQRGIIQLEYIIIDVSAQILKFDKEIESLVAETELSDIPMARIIKESLETLCRNFFEDNYYKHSVSGKVLEFTREIIRDQVTERKGLHKILFQLFFIGKDFKYTRENGGLFRLIQEYTDIIDTLEVYSGVIYQEIKGTSDPEKIQSRIQELQAKIEEFQTKKDLITKNEVAFL
ncbi:MAG: helicase-related protein [Candidatus Gracilibacteria bacterium]|nr:helicase-related protein [Candidatus Gracilibacteria bacterium]